MVLAGFSFGASSLCDSTSKNCLVIPTARVVIRNHSVVIVVAPTGSGNIRRNSDLLQEDKSIGFLCV